MRLATDNSPPVTKRGGAELRGAKNRGGRSPGAGPPRHDAGETLDRARARDRAWRDAQVEAVQVRIDRAFEAELAGRRLVRWGWLGALGGLVSLLLWVPARDLFRIWHAEAMGVAAFWLCIGGLALALAAIPSGGLVRVLARGVRRRLVRRAKKDRLDVWDPA